MPREKDLKRLVRARMKKTGEAYTAARAQVLRKSTKLAPPSPEYAKLAGMADDVVKEKTGRTWTEWVRALDTHDAERMKHPEIAALLSRTYDVPDWWSQMVTVGYEQARGLRAIHQKMDGFSASASKTFQANLERLYGAWNDPALREMWLPGAPLQVRRSTDGKSMRITWTLGNSNVDVNFYAKGPDKSMVQIEHSKLSDAEAVAAQKAFWSEGLERLNAWLASARPQS